MLRFKDAIVHLVTCIIPVAYHVKTEILIGFFENLFGYMNPMESTTKYVHGTFVKVKVLLHIHDDYFSHFKIMI